MNLLSIMDIKKISEDILNSKKVREFHPEAIVFIERAGRLIAKYMEDFSGLPAYPLSTHRAGESLKDKLKHIFNFLPWQISHFIRKLELSTSVHSTFDDRKIIVNKALPLDKETKIIVVDDAIDSGTSIKSVLNFLNGLGYTNIFTAVLTTTSSKPIYQADYSHFNHLITFPWSIGSPEFYKYQKVYHSLDERYEK